MHMQVVHNAYSPKETTELCSRAGVMKGNMRADKVFFSSFLAGCILAFACAGTLVVSVSPWYQENAPGLIAMLGAIVFPWGLVSILLTGTDLCTGSFMLTTIAVLHRRLSLWKMLLHWFITFWGNLAGSLFVMGIVIGYGGTFSQPVYQERVVTFCTSKAVTPEWHQVFLRGIGANWLVCLAAYLSFAGRELISKIAGIWWPTFAFVILAFDHVVANMFYLPLGIFVGTPGLTVGHYIAYSMIPSLIGNIVGGGLFVGVIYWYLYLSDDSSPNTIDDELWAGDQSVDTFIGQPSRDREYGERSGQQTPSLQHGKETKSPENMV